MSEVAGPDLAGKHRHLRTTLDADKWLEAFLADDTWADDYIRAWLAAALLVGHDCGYDDGYARATRDMHEGSNKPF